MIRIGVDSRPLREKQTSGIPRYVRSVLESLSRLDQENEYVLYAHKDFDFSLPNARWSKKSGARTKFGSVWMQTELPYWLKRDKIDVFWGTQHNLPLLMSKRIKAVLTILDLVHLVFPETMRPLNLIINKVIIPPSVKRADAIVAISKWTLQDVKKYLNPQNKIMDVTYMAVGPQFSPRSQEASQAIVRDKFGLKSPFLLTLGTFEPRKNVHGILEAFSLIADKIPHQLVIVGQRGWKNEQVMEEIRTSNIHHRIHLLGYVPDESILDLYSAADVFIFPSLYEGFGIPPLEAMACGAPVVASNVSSIPEVVGDAAMLVDPKSAQDIAEGILKVVNSSELRQDLIRRGLVQAKQFNWDKTAGQMMNIFSRLKRAS